MNNQNIKLTEQYDMIWYDIRNTIKQLFNRVSYIISYHIALLVLWLFIYRFYFIYLFIYLSIYLFWVYDWRNILHFGGIKPSVRVCFTFGSSLHKNTGEQEL